ncbi:universal stress protein [Lewinella sp. W8]|uniref:universal stress protein n=1 Tax=Lewinella sp. W8 TaxID=2528208 RepID=UPI001067AD4E|nr:universal stress protein [Lewinella sp. W8]MTB51243.1 hypothetical protein [Lewinella sp. W8]
MKNILFLNGYTEYARDYYRFSLRFARRLGSTLHLAHIYDFRNNLDERGYDAFVRPGEFNAWLLDVQREESMELDQFVAENTGKQNMPLIGETYAYEGDVVNEVPKLLEHGDFDLVVIGLVAHSLLRDLLTRNLTQYLVDTAQCPLLLLPPRATQNLIRKICFATDLTPGTLSAINYGFDLSLRLSAEYQLLTVVKEKDAVPATQDRIDTLQQKIHGGYTSRLPYRVVVGNPEKEIRHFTRTEGTDLLMLTTRQRKRWIDQFTQTITKAIVREAAIPLLVLKEDYLDVYKV